MPRLSDEDLKQQKDWLYKIGWKPEWVEGLFDTIEAQQKEIEQLKSDLEECQQALCVEVSKSERLEAQNAAQKELLEAFRHVQALFDDGIYIRCPYCETEIYYEDWPHNWKDHDEGCIVGEMIREAIGGGQ